MTEAAAHTQFFLIDDAIVWFWCKLVGCDMKPPPAKEEKKQESKTQTITIKNTTKEKEPEKKEAANKTEAAAETNSTSGAGLDDDILRQIRESKAKQDKGMGTDALGKKEADNAKTVTDNKKDMTVPEPGKESLKDDGPSLAASKKKMMSQMSSEEKDKLVHH
jgi:hypothetical protein